MNHGKGIHRWLAWASIGLGFAVLLFALAGSFSGFDPKGAGGLVFAAFLLLATGWIVGDF